MADTLRGQARALLRRALDDPSAEFREGQWDAIERLIQGRAKLLVVQRTGWGKSVVYFLATRLMRDHGAGTTLLISPLLALMRNQIAMAERLGVRAATINSSNRSEWEQMKTEVLADRVDILLISPERLANDKFRESILLPIAERVGLFVVDEGHCISDWGHDFRPDYRRIVRVLQALPQNIPALVTTATANDRVVQDIVDQLGHDLQVIRGPLGRSSLRLQNIYLGNQAARMAWLVKHLPSMPGNGIIYTLTVKDAQRVAAWLQSQGINAHSYWGRLNSEDRIRLENQLLDNKVKALVATTALGMGFDKPDLGFVIHFQRPGSVIHYYQQVGRAGRAIDQAYGILLSGDEDPNITDYFIRAAFPPEGHAEQVLDALSHAEDGLSVRMLEERMNLAQGQIRKVLKLLAVETPSPVSRRGSRWYRNPVPYAPDREKIEHLTLIRKQEQRKMLEYMHSQDCLMAFLQRELDDPKPVPCGRCAVCLGEPLLPETYSSEIFSQAEQFLRHRDQVIVPRKTWVVQPGKIPEHLRAEEGRALCLWGDAGWGELVKRGKQVDGRFDQRLILAAAEMISARWKPSLFPVWVTCVPSLNHPVLVPDFARRLAQQLGLRFVECVKKIRQTEPQKVMNNSYQQAKNLKGAFVVVPWDGIADPVLLIDDMVDSRWTLTAIAVKLRQAGSGPVYPMALADTRGLG